MLNIKQIITYGHSMADVDWPYFEEIIKLLGVKIPWKVSCYSHEDAPNIDKFSHFFKLTDVTKLINGTNGKAVK